MIHIKLIIVALLWAGGFIAGKLITEQAGPFTISFFRFFIATVILGGLLFMNQQPVKITRKMLFSAVLAAFFGVFCYNYLFLTGLKYIDASRGSVILSIVPMMVAVFSYMFFKEGIGVLKAIGIGVSVFGAATVITHGKLSVLITQQIGLGEFYLVICVLCASIFAILSKQMLKISTPLLTIFYVSAFGTIFLCVPAIWEMVYQPVNLLSYKFAINLLYLAIGPSVVAVMFYYQAIHHIGAARATQYMNLMPVFAVVLAGVFLGENVTGSLLFGGGLVTAGLYLANFGS